MPEICIAKREQGKREMDLGLTRTVQGIEHMGMA